MEAASALDPSLALVNRGPQAASSLFDGGGEMGELMRQIDWSKTSVGPVESWPQSLRTALSVLLKQRTAVFIFWGPEHVQFYNDAYRPILGTKKHPAAMGQRGAECWPEIWDIIRPLLETVHGGESTGVEDGLLVIDRNGYLEEGYYTYTYSPIAVESGTVGGVFCVVYDTTHRVIGERRLRTLRDLASRTRATDAEQACRSAAATLSANPYDVPFAALYVFEDDRKSARLVGAAGCEAGSPVSPRWIWFEGEDLSLVARAASESRVVEVSNLSGELGPLPGGPWPVGAESAIVLPLAVPGQELPAGFLVAGVSPRKRLDASYRTFFELAAAQIATAIAEARAYEQERQRAEMLAELDRAKTTFFSNVSHEFRTPLTLMLGPISDILSKPGITVEECKQELAVAHRNCLRLFKLVNTLLDFSRIEAGRIRARYEPVDLATLTSDLASVFRSAIERAHLRLIVECPPLPEPVFVDREMWEKIVLNLVSNAVKFTLQGEIEIALKAVGEHVELAVRDTGVGIPEPELGRVFDRFHQIESTKGRSQEGSGIGLALVQELTRLHGGRVRVQSTLGQGSTFTVFIPFGSSHLPQEKISDVQTHQSSALGAQPFLEEALRWLPDAAVPEPAANLVAPHQQLGRETVAGGWQHEKRAARILVADDNSDMRDYLRRLLGEQYQVATVSDGASALQAVHENPPDLLLADVMMPGLDGFGLLHAIRTDPALGSLPVILLSARAGEESRVEGLKAGADDYIVKPFSARELLVRVASRLEIAKLRNEAAEAELNNLRNLIQLAPAALALLSGPHHVFQLANREYLRVTGRSEKELIGKPVAEALPEIRSQAFVDLLDGVYHTGEPCVGIEALAKLDRRRDGSLDEQFFNFVYQPWTDALRRTQGVFVHAVDVTEQVVARHRLEKQIEEQTRVENELRRANQDLEQFAYSASHDLQEPLRSIKIYGELLTSRFASKLDGQAAEFLNYLQTGASRMEMLVRDLLAYTQVTKLDMPVQDTDANDALGASLDSLSQSLAESGARVTRDALPRVRVHNTHLRQVFQNLIGNAIKYRSPERAPAVHVGCERQDAYWLFSVRDNGIGIEPEYKEHIFGLFKRLHSGDEYSGTGIGLAICQRIVERYHGRIWVQSQPGRGSTFLFTVPV